MANDEQLRRMLRDRFRDHETEPPAGLGKTILSKVAPASRWWQTIAGQAVILVGGLLVGGGVWWFSQFDQPRTQQASGARSVPTTRHLTTADRPATVSSGTILDRARPESTQPSNADTELTLADAESVSSPLGRMSKWAPTKGADRPLPRSGKASTPGTIERPEAPAKLLAPDSGQGASSSRRVSPPGNRRAVSPAWPNDPLGSAKLVVAHRKPLADKPHQKRRSSEFRYRWHKLAHEFPHGPTATENRVALRPAAASRQLANQSMFISWLTIRPFRLVPPHSNLVPVVLPTLPSAPVQQHRPSLAFAGGVMAGPQLVYASEHPVRPGWSIGAWGTLRLSSRLLLETGLTLARPSLVSRPDSGMVIQDTLYRQLTKQTQAWWQLSMPLLIRYEWGINARRKWSVAAGLSSGVSLSPVLTSDYTLSKRRSPADTTGQSSSRQEQVVEWGAPVWQAFRWVHVSSTLELTNLGKHRLWLEPYLLFPLGNAASPSPRTTQAGLYLRVELGSRLRSTSSDGLRQ